MTVSVHESEDYPASQGRSLRIALLYNLASHAPEPPDAPPDYLYELDHEHNVAAYRAALESRGHAVFPMEGDTDLPARLRLSPVDICFNTCEGFRGDSREAQAPALLEMIGTDLEINSLPGMTPISDLALMARAEGWTHADLINGILDAALRRYGFIEALIRREEKVRQWTPV